jgi:hypothetical protein
MRRNDRERLDEGNGDPLAQVAEADHLVWQRLVDNRLSDEEYRQLLLDLETKPGLWRACALAFLEDQAVKQALSAWRSHGAEARAAGGRSERPASAGGVRPRSADGDDRSADHMPGSAASMASAPGPLGGGWFQPLLVTVSLAAGFLLAMFAFSSRDADIGNSAVDAQAGTTAQVGPVPVGEPVMMDRESFKDFLADLPPEQRLELFRRPTQQRVSPTVAARPASLVPGEVEAERRFLFYRTTDGGMIVVPVDDYRFVAQEFQ